MIIGITGRKGSGKDTVTNYICEQHPFLTHYKLSFPIKAVGEVLFSWGEDYQEGIYKDRIDSRYGISPREFYKLFGKEILQDIMCEYFPKFKDIIGKNFSTYFFNENIFKKNPISNYIISDIRYQCEIDELKKIGVCYVIRINRIESSQEEDYHDSENKVKDLIVDYEISNNLSKNDLFKSVDNFLKIIL